MSVHEWLVLLRPDGVIESASGGAPVTWLGRHLSDAPDVPDFVRKAGEALLAQTDASTYVRRGRVDVGAVAVEMLLIEALPIRRAHTRINELVMRTMDVFASQAHSVNAELALDITRNVPSTLFIDGEKIAWALATLVGSALRHAQQRDEQPRVTIRVAWNADEEALVFEVSDNGHGMSEQHARHLFERDPATGKAAGLALLMVRDVVVWHRGSVEVDSRPGRGTTLTMKLPRVHS
jgi:signal transduction histidine kinase